MQEKEKIKKLIENNRIGMFVTQDQDEIFSRPIAYADVDEDNFVWFFTDVNSDKIDHIINNKQVNFSFANHADNAYVSLAGKAELVKDAAIIDEKWKFFMKAWFPEGKNADRLILIKVIPHTAQYWDGTSSKILLMYQMAKALVTNKSYVKVSNSKNNVVKF